MFAFGCVGSSVKAIITKSCKCKEGRKLVVVGIDVAFRIGNNAHLILCILFLKGGFSANGSHLCILI